MESKIPDERGKEDIVAQEACKKKFYVLRPADMCWNGVDQVKLELMSLFTPSMAITP